MRQTKYELLTPEPMKVPVTGYQCDKCGEDISREAYANNYAHELEIALDQDECVRFYRRRDYCPDCLESIWLTINQLIGADPDYPGNDPEE
jgi:hypothetical protein